MAYLAQFDIVLNSDLRGISLICLQYHLLGGSGEAQLKPENSAAGVDRW